MKRFLKSLFGCFLILSFIACSSNVDQNSGKTDETENTSGTNQSGESGENETPSESDLQKADTIIIDGSKVTSTWAIATIGLSEFANKTVTVSVSAKMKVENTGSSAANIMWQMNTGKDTYPVVSSKQWNAVTSEYITISDTKTGIENGDGPIFYISTGKLTLSEIKIYLQNLKITVTDEADSTNTKTFTEFDKNDAITIEKADSSNNENTGESTGTEGTQTADNSKNEWTSNAVPSLKETFVDGGFFDRFGLACEVDELSNSETAKGIRYHANTTTPGNELKPQFILWEYSQPKHTAEFTASNGKTIKVPNTIHFDLYMDKYLAAAKAAGIQIRGHVLTWHSQTFDWFFTEDYAYTVTTDSDGKPTNLVDKETMTARHEWYIKSVLEHVAEWEAANGYGEGNHLIYSWDVVNEAVADDAQDNDTNYLRGSTSNTKNKAPDNGGGSRWYQVYESDEFIVNAIRFANAYAPSDVTLCYNDYNEYMNYAGNHGAWKTNGIKRLITAVKNGEEQTVNGKAVKPRIDAMGMQSHVGQSWPGVSGYERAIKEFLSLGIDIQITEFDIETTLKDDTTNWANYFKMILTYSKKGSEISKYNGHHITGVTLWGLNDENSWISKNGTIYGLVFTKQDGKYYAKDCFYSVINAAKAYSKQ